MDPLARAASKPLTWHAIATATVAAVAAAYTARILVRFARRNLMSNRPQAIIFIRHGESEGNLDTQRYSTTPDALIKLTPAGVQQAKELGTRLKERLRGRHLLVYVSPYARTRQTARIALAELKSQVKLWVEDPRLREQEFSGSFQRDRVPYEERIRYGKFFFRWPGGESAADVYDRASLFLDTLHRDFSKHTARNDVVLVFTHGLTARVLLMRWMHFSVETFELTSNPPNCGCLELVRTMYNGAQAYRITDATAKVLFPGLDEEARRGHIMPRRERRSSSWQELPGSTPSPVLAAANDPLPAPPPPVSLDEDGRVGDSFRVGSKELNPAPPTPDTETEGEEEEEDDPTIVGVSTALRRSVSLGGEGSRRGSSVLIDETSHGGASWRVSPAS